MSEMSEILHVVNQHMQELCKIKEKYPNLNVWIYDCFVYQNKSYHKFLC